jgi:hypothetical protein
MPLRKAMERAFNLGQTYWQQADHEFTSQQRKADVTQQTFRDFADATCAQYDGSLTAAEAERDALRARVAGLEASEKLLQQAHSAVLRSLQKQAPCFADTDRLDAMEKQSWTVGHYASGRYFVHLGLINGKQCETTGSALRIAIDEARALLAPSSEETK